MLCHVWLTPMGGLTLSEKWMEGGRKEVEEEVGGEEGEENVVGM